MSTPTDTQRGIDELNAIAQQRHGRDAEDLTWDELRGLETGLLSEREGSAAIQAGVERQLALMRTPPECGCRAVEYRVDENGVKDYTTLRVAHTCAGRDVFEVLISTDGGELWDAYAVAVEDVDQVLDDDEDLDRFALAVHGRLVSELTRADRETVQKRHQAASRAYYGREALVDHLRQTVRECACPTVTVLRDDGTANYEHLFVSHDEVCPAGQTIRDQRDAA